MLARRRCATRICLSCRFALSRPELVARRPARPFPQTYPSNLNQRLFSSSIGQRSTSSNSPDAPTEGQKPPPTNDPFAFLEANRRQEPSQPPTKTKRKRKSKSKANADGDINATKDFSLESWDALPPTESKPKPKRNSKAKSKPKAQAQEDDPFASLEIGRRLDNPRNVANSQRGQNNGTVTNKGRNSTKQTQPLVEPAIDPVQPIETPASASIYDVSPVPESKAVDDASKELDDNDIFEVERLQEHMDAIDDDVYVTSQPTTLDDDGQLHKLQDRPVHKRSARGPRGRSSRQDLQHRHIGVDALGQPGAAIILDNPDMLTRKRSTPLDQPSEDEARLAIELGLLNPRETFDSPQSLADEAMANIDELNLRGVGMLSEKELLRHRDTLAGSFTMKQLDAYLQAHAKNDDVSPTLALKEKGFKSVTEFTTEWTPNTPDIPSGMTRKQLLAFLIITRAWDVEISSSASPGSMQLKLNSDLYAVLAQSTTGALNFAKARLDESAGESISFDSSGPTIEVRCSKESVRNVLNRLETLHGAVKTARPSSSGVPEEHVSWPEFRDEVARITGTAIELEEDQIVIRWMEYRQPELPDDPALPPISIENKGDVAMRLLRGQQHNARLSSVTAAQMDESADLNRCTHVPHVADTRSMSLSDKLRPWTRWTAPTLKARTDTPPDLYPVFGEVKVPGTKWRPDLKAAHAQHLNASFGHILHSSPKDPSLKASAVDRILSPTIPHPASFNKIMSEGAIARSAFILLKFTPTQMNQKQKPRKSAKNTEPPAVHLKLPVNPDSDFSSFTMPEDATLYAERLGVMYDVLLPENPVDVRLDMQERLSLDLTDQPALLKFFEASDFNLAEGQLLTPPKVELSVPPTWPNAGKKEQWSTQAYDFAGLEVHQVVSLEWQAQLLRYSSIEAGQQGGRRQQLTLECQYTQDTDLAEQHGAFLKAVDDISLGRAFPWTDGHKLVVEEAIPEDVSEGAELWTGTSIESDGQEAALGMEHAGEALDQLDSLVQREVASGGDGDFGRQGASDAAFTAEQLGEQVTSAAEKLQQLSISVKDAIYSHAEAATMDDTTYDASPMAGEELWASIATEDCEAAIVEADQLMEAVEDALTSFMGEDAGQNAIEEVDDNSHVPDPMTSQGSEAALDGRSEAISSVDDSSPTRTIDYHNAAVNDEVREDADQTTDISQGVSSNAPTTTNDAVANTAGQPDRAEETTTSEDAETTPGQASNPPVYNKKVEADDSSPWGHALSLFR